MGGRKNSVLAVNANMRVVTPQQLRYSCSSAKRSLAFFYNLCKTTGCYVQALVSCLKEMVLFFCLFEFIIRRIIIIMG